MIYKSLTGLPLKGDSLHGTFLGEFLENTPTYISYLDEYIFKCLNSDYQYIHIQKAIKKVLGEGSFYGVQVDQRSIATNTMDKVFSEEQEIINLEEIRNKLKEHKIDYKNSTLKQLNVEMQGIL